MKLNIVIKMKITKIDSKLHIKRRDLGKGRVQI